MGTLVKNGSELETVQAAQIGGGPVAYDMEVEETSDLNAMADTLENRWNAFLNDANNEMAEMVKIISDQKAKLIETNRELYKRLDGKIFGRKIINFL